MEDVKRYGVIEALQKAKMTNKEADSVAFYTIPTGGIYAKRKKNRHHTNIKKNKGRH
jgi:hypothetical protein